MPGRLIQALPLVTVLLFAAQALAQEQSGDYAEGFQFGMELAQSASAERDKPTAPEISTLENPEEWLRGREDGIDFVLCMAERLVAQAEEYDRITTGTPLREQTDGYKERLIDAFTERARRECRNHYQPSPD